jgi:hypothetical protein
MEEALKLIAVILTGTSLVGATVTISPVYKR